MSCKRSLPIEEFHVGVVCALPREMTAVAAMLDEEDERPKSKDVIDVAAIAQRNV
jgi:hypothetical protein